MDGLTADQYRAWRALLAARSAVLGQIETDLAAVGNLNLGEFDVLTQLALHDNRMRMSSLAELVHASRSGLTRRIDRLSRRGLVERTVDPDDRRGAFAVLSDAGEAVLAELLPAHVASLRTRVLEVLTPDELDTLTELLERLADAANQAESSRA